MVEIPRVVSKAVVIQPWPATQGRSGWRCVRSASLPPRVPRAPSPAEEEREEINWEMAHGTYLVMYNDKWNITRYH